MSQERRLMRRLERQAGVASGNPRTMLPQWTPQDEQDGRRDRLAERLLEIGLEECGFESFTDTHRREQVAGKDHDTERAVLTLEEWYVKHAKAALAAAEIIFPEIPEAGS